MTEYQQGDPIRLVTTVHDASGVAADPTSLSLVYRKPSGVETTVPFGSLTNEAGTGVWSYTIAAGDEAGTWAWRWVAVTPAWTDEGVFDVLASATVGERLTGPGPCQAWCEPADLTAGGWDAPADATQQILEQACRAASEACYELGGRRWPGLCWDSIVPQCCPGASWMPLVLPNGRGGLGIMSAHALGPCWGGSIVDLGHGNVTAIDEVRIDGTAIASTAWRLLDGRWLARIDGASFPCGNDPTAATIGFEVDFTFGSAPPALGVFAAIALARELVRGLASGGDCAIDSRVVGLVREGVSLDLSSTGAEGGFMEVEAVRRFVNAYNPHGLQRAAAVIVPGSDRHVHR